MTGTPPSFEPLRPRRRPSDATAKHVGSGHVARRDSAEKKATASAPESYRPPAQEPRTRQPSSPPARASYQPVSYPPPSIPPVSGAPASIPPRGVRSAAKPLATMRPVGSDSAANSSTTPSKPTRRRKKWPWLLTPLVLILLLLIAWPAYLIHYGNSKLHHIEALSGAPDTPGTTYLIVGSDKREAGAINDGTEGERSDSIMLLQVPESGTPSLVSIPRDSYVEIPGHESGKINAAYSLGGPGLLVKTVEKLTGMTIDHYIEVSMFGVQELTNAVGGINLCLDYDVSDEFSGLQWTAGCADVDGYTALAFSRMRYSDPSGDIGRTMRQRQVVSKIVDKAASRQTLLSPSHQKKLVGTVADNLTTDTDTSIIGVGRAGLGLRTIMKEGGLIGTPPITSLNVRHRGQSTVELDEDLIGTFFEKMKNGKLEAADFPPLP